DLFDVHRLALIQKRQMGRQVNSLDQRAHEGLRDVRNVQSGLDIAAQRKNLQPELISAGLRIAAQIAAALESAKNVTRRTFGDLQTAAQLGLGEAVSAASDHVQEWSGAFSGR